MLEQLRLCDVAHHRRAKVSPDGTTDPRKDTSDDRGAFTRMSGEDQGNQTRGVETELAREMGQSAWLSIV